jgi:hypothetical protein
MATSKRKLIEPHGGDGRSLAAGRRSRSKTVARPGRGDKGHRRALVT